MRSSGNRRGYLARAILIATGATVAGAASAAGEGREGKCGKHAHAFTLPANTANKCGTCVFRDGQRHVTRDKSAAHVFSLGMCNNPASLNSHTTTSPDTGPMETWVKWPALG